MKLNSKYLETYDEQYNGFHNALGLYDSMQFVLRLRTDIHNKIKSLPSGIVSSKQIDFEGIQAYSTYIHETIHWWQHMGSTSGLVLSLIHPMQMHVNKMFLDRFLQTTGTVKSIKKYNELNAKEYQPVDEEFQIINHIINNFSDIEFFKYLVIFPKEAKQVVNDPFFESVGHTFHITYSAFVHLLTECFDKEQKYFPKIENWDEQFRKLNENKATGFYHGSDVYISPIGLKAIYEGQARFIQIQYLYFGIGKKLTWNDFNDLGMLSGDYIEAFNSFLTLTDSQFPESIDDPLVGLYLLICDLAINPMEGFPFEIENFENFINTTNPGIRFITLCKLVKDKFPEVKDSIQKYSSEEYYEVSNKLCKAANYKSPLDGAKKILDWSKIIPSLIDLVEEEKTFTFNLENFPIRLMFSKFVNFQKDKYINPAFFCWAGYHFTAENISEQTFNMFAEHEALFIDDIDGDIYPRKLPNKEEKQLTDTMTTFYTWISAYDLTRQWITKEGKFEYDYLWLTSKYTPEEVNRWAKHAFSNIFKVDPDEFQII
ncbi:hypothetical protein [Francisella sciaenopsi]|uniref:Uncharacterized protein n=1 Tax=Francisella sciaenopsi TaxID=3055034 RepID=A0ABQ6PH55_9GAMM